MAKKKKDDNIMESLLFDLEAKYGGYTIDEQREKVRGVPIPHWGLQWGLDSNVWFLGFMYMVAGKWGSGKTQMMLRAARDFLDHDPKAIVFFLPTEGKDTPTQADSILGPHVHDKPRRFFIIPAQILGKFESMTKKNVTELEGESLFNICFNLFQAYKEYGHPVLILADSLLGAPTEGAYHAIEDAEGSVAGRSTLGMERASELTQWLPWAVQQIAGSNITFMFSNHAKPKIEVSGPKSFGETVKWPGGEQVSASPNTIIYLSPGLARKTIEKDLTAFNIRLFKNSNGTKKRAVTVETFYRVARDADGNVIRDKNGHPVREIVWDWDQCTCDVLSSFFQTGYKDSRGPEGYRKELSIVKSGNANKPLYTMKYWGLEDATPAEVAAFLRSDTEEGAAARDFLMTFDKVHVVHNTVFQPED